MGKEKKNTFLFLQGIFGFCDFFFYYRFSVPEAVPFPAERDSSFDRMYVLAKLIGAVVCHPFLPGWLGELDIPLQHCPLFGEVKITAPKIVNVNSLSPGLVHQTLQSHRRLFAWRWIDANILLRLVRHDAFVFDHKHLSMLNSQGALHFRWFLPSPFGGYNHPLKKQK